VPAANQRLVVLDGKAKKMKFCFGGLASDAARPNYEKLSVSYLIERSRSPGPQSEFPGTAGSMITDDHYGILGVLASK